MRVPDDDFLVLESDLGIDHRVVARTYPKEFDAIRRGKPFTSWAQERGSFVVTVDSHVRLSDDMADLVRYEDFHFASDTMRALLVAFELPGLALLPTRLTNASGGAFAQSYHVMCPPLEDVLDAQASGADTTLGYVTGVKKIVLRKTPVAPLFRVATMKSLTLIARSLAVRLAKEKLRGLKLGSLDARY